MCRAGLRGQTVRCGDVVWARFKNLYELQLVALGGDSLGTQSEQIGGHVHALAPIMPQVQHETKRVCQPPGTHCLILTGFLGLSLSLCTRRGPPCSSSGLGLSS